MRIGYSLGPLLSISEVLACAKMADQKQNVDSIWMPESWGRESFSTLGAVSQVTKRVRLGTSIISIFARTPATIAMAASTLDMLSANRAVIGLGTSTEAIVENWHGVKFEKPASRMREYVQCIRLMLTGEKVNFDGQFFKIKNFKMLHNPARKDTPIYVAAVNKNMVALAAELADGAIFYLRPIEELKNTVSEIKSRRRDFEIALSLICAVSDKEPQKARERAAKTLAFYIAVGKFYSNFLAENGFKNEVEAIISEYRKNGGDSAGRQVSDKMLDSLTVCGSAEDCIKSLDRFVAAGITLPILQVNPVSDAEGSFREMLSTF
jgi:alkanesulfonate monooxygenase SsuD/methylene tetrahydromethanopterin reductase-like flavin-dependent oxidoreductase (luciferase family)